MSPKITAVGALDAGQQALGAIATGYSVYSFFANRYKPDVGFCMTSTDPTSALLKGYGDISSAIFLLSGLYYFLTRTEENKKTEDDIKVISCIIQGIGTLLVVNLAGAMVARAGFAIFAWIDVLGEVIAYCNIEQSNEAQKEEHIKLIKLKLWVAAGLTLQAVACHLAPLAAAIMGTIGTVFFVAAMTPTYDTLCNKKDSSTDSEAPPPSSRVAAYA